MNKENIESFISSCDELITCKFLVAEYKIQKVLQELANAEEICSLIGECLEQFNREREFAKTYIQDGNGEFVCEMPNEEFKVLALVFCTLVDIDNKKIDFTDFVKRFFGKNDNAFENFVQTMIIPFRNLIADAFGYPQINLVGNKEEIREEEKQETSQYEQEEELEEQEDEFKVSQKIAVQILSELQYVRQDYNSILANYICKSIVKTSSLRDHEVTTSLVFALKNCKIKSIKFLVKEICDLFDI